MPLSGVVIKCRPELTEGLATTLAKQETVEIHGAMPDGRLVAVIESDSLEGEL